MKTQKLKLNKEAVAKLNDDSMHQVKAGVAKFWTFEGNCTAGCTDGCGPLNTEWHCSKADCTIDCYWHTKVNRVCTVKDCITDGCTIRFCPPRPTMTDQ